MPRLPPIHLASIVGFALAIVLLARELRKRRAPSVTFAWLLAILLVPYVGVPLYVLFGGRKQARRAARKPRLYAQRADVSAERPIERLLDGAGVRPATTDNDVTLLPTGEAAYQAMLELIDGAERSIHVSTFILGGDEVGDAIVEHLTRRAADKIETRLLLDGVFAFRADKKKLSALREAGGGVAIFMPLLHLPFRGRSNLRNHRKIAVADGARAIIGGMNLAEEYMGPRPLPARWVDVALRIDGGAASDLDAIFREDWAFASDENLRAVPGEPGGSGGAEVRVVASGPDVETDTLYDAILFALFSAKERIWIATPYFVPDEALVRALALACRRGIDVRIVVPTPSNHTMADLAGATYLRTLESAGAAVRPYRRGMLHAKVIVIDHDLAMVGSANFDMRSLFLNYEVMSILFAPREVETMAAWFEALTRLTESKLRAAGRSRLVVEDVARLFGPLV